ncbi:MAG: DNA-processing protein DprA [Gammaproteobacteria bacterium]|nr:DNA-processing protein DprA [Gammaproteobacteria bacterium]MCW8988025.1 DNA-processing protein DprA [Gammaproteobacteria bacterium]
MTQTEQSLRNWLALTHIPSLGPVRIHSLLDVFETPSEILNAGNSIWKEVGLSEKIIQGLSVPDWDKVDVDLKWAEQEENACILTLDDERYPSLLKAIPDAPPILYVLGQPEILSLPQFAIVGSRNPTHAGQDIAHDFAAYLTKMGMTITSGMALGIDTAAHQGALDTMQSDYHGHGFTVAVTGTGLDRVYPAKNREIAHKIAENGVLVSEYAPGTPPLPGNFPRRNRIISGLSMGVLVVEAALQSGSLITARLATEQGREVFAVPGSINHPLAKGCHALIRQGAKLVETADHILEELGGFVAMLDKSADESKIANKEGNEREFAAYQNVDDEYKQVLKCVDFEPTSVDKVVERSGLTADAVCSMLLVLELQGYVTALSGGYYCQGR